MISSWIQLKTLVWSHHSKFQSNNNVKIMIFGENHQQIITYSKKTAEKKENESIKYPI